jgi:streptomycin 6-kinase
MALTVPSRLIAACSKTPERAAWLERLPGLVAELTRRWALRLGDPFDNDETSCAWVAPATRVEGARAVLKVGMPHLEGEHEIQGLRFWNGDSIVQLLEADEALSAMLLERCEPGTSLRGESESEQDVVVARLLTRLWRAPAAPDVFRPLSTMLQHWSEETEAASTRWQDPGLVQEGLRLFRDLPLSAPRNILLATDLHAGNVLRTQREPWLAIDPKPFVGDPAYDATQHLLNCRARLRTDLDSTIRRFADLLEVDHERVRAWTFARAAAEPRDDWKNDPLIDIARRLAL